MTNRITLSDNEWVEISNGAFFAEKPPKGGSLLLHIGTSVPNISETGYHILDGNGGFSYGGNKSCYARSAHGSADIILTLV